MSDTRADIAIDWHPALRDAAAHLARALAATAAEPFRLVPASLRRDDAALAALRDGLRDLALRSTVLVPRSPTALLARKGGAGWRQATIDGRRWRVDARLAEAPWVAVATVDVGRHRGPFVLDLPARYLHPADRLRLAARPDRLRDLADIAAVATPATCLVLTPADGGWLVLTTRDPIAAELWALGLAERFHEAGIEMQGPWEEPAVQRATELGLGVRIPADMRVTASVPATAARSLLYRTAGRLGLALDTERAENRVRKEGATDRS